MTTTAHSVTPHDATAHDPIRHDPIRHDPIRHDPIRHDPIRHDPIRHDPIRHDATTNDATLDEAVRAVTAALATLNTDPAGDDVEASIERAGLLLAALEPSLTAIVLNRLLASIRDCHREGQRTSAQLRARRASAARALHLDPRRHSHRARKAS